ncbi:MAG: hypothetical protein H6Q13_3028 [Bacteroidetes bacterium]|nr:hypothetical protein [Bacteroidota bacterium]
MKRSLLLVSLFAGLLSGCSQDSEVVESVSRPDGKSQIVITGEGITSTRADGSGKVEFTGGYATGAGLYDGDAQAAVKAVAYDGYRLTQFEGGPSGESTTLTGANAYEFDIQRQDWQFSVSFKKEYLISLIAESGGTVAGGGTVLDGENITVTATPTAGYSFLGWYEGATKVSSLASYIFTVSSNRTLTSSLFMRISDFC